MTNSQTSLRWLIAVTSLVFVAGCGIPFDAAPTQLAVPEDQDPEATTPTTQAPSPDQAEGKVVYFIKDGLLQPVRRNIAEPVSNQSVFDALAQGPTESELEDGIETRLTVDVFEAQVALAGDVLTVNVLNEGGLQFEGEQRILAIAQIVFTAHFGTSATGGVRFQEAGQFTAEPNGNGEVQELSEDGIPVPLTIADFAELSAGATTVPAGGGSSS